MAALILLLGMLAVSPTWHAWLHAEKTVSATANEPAGPIKAVKSADHLCVISDFAHGVTSALTFIAIAQPAAHPAGRSPVAVALHLPPTRWLLQPGRAPPTV